MEARSTTVESNGESSEHCNVRFAGDVAEEDDAEMILKTRISSHPLFGLLIETHLNCLKVGLGELGEFGTTNGANQAPRSPKPNLPASSELDRFMAEYCMTLGKLKEAMLEPLQDTASFIEAMYIQLRELCETHPNNSKPNSPTP